MQAELAQAARARRVRGALEAALTAVKKTTAEKLAVGEFLAYCEANPTTLSWMAFYDDIDEAAPLADAAYADLTQPPPGAARAASRATNWPT